MKTHHGGLLAVAPMLAMAGCAPTPLRAGLASQVFCPFEDGCLCLRTASAAWAHGLAVLAAGEAATAVRALRRARQRWREVDAPYEAARTSALLAEGLMAEGDATVPSLNSNRRVRRSSGSALTPTPGVPPSGWRSCAKRRPSGWSRGGP